ncbi:hypothetical protein Acid7E03_15240 [Acidisoma sp. 7E03]
MDEGDSDIRQEGGRAKPKTERRQPPGEREREQAEQDHDPVRPALPKAEFARRHSEETLRPKGHKQGAKAHGDQKKGGAAIRG